MAKLWATFNNGAELEIEQADAEECYHSGQCDADVRRVAGLPYIKRQLDKIGHEKMAAELREYGAWSDEELADEQDTRERFLWLAAGDVVENPQFEGREIHNGEVE